MKESARRYRNEEPNCLRRFLLHPGSRLQLRTLTRPHADRASCWPNPWTWHWGAVARAPPCGPLRCCCSSGGNKQRFKRPPAVTLSSILLHTGPVCTPVPSPHRWAPRRTQRISYSPCKTQVKCNRPRKPTGPHSTFKR